MPLPKSAEIRGEVHLSGGVVSVRGLTIAEIRQVRAITDTNASDRLAIILATGDSAEDVDEWWSTALAGDVVKLLDAVFTCSGMGDDAQFPGGQGDDAGAAGSADTG